MDAEAAVPMLTIHEQRVQVRSAVVIVNAPKTDSGERRVLPRTICNVA